MPAACRRVLALALALAGCGPSAPPSEPGVVARIDSLRIRAADLQAFAARVPAEGDVATRRQSYLRGLLARHLLEREARALGLDTLTAVRLQVEAMWQDRLRERYRRQMIWDRVQVDADQVRSYFDSLGLARQRQVWGILLDSRAEAEAALADLRAGRPFEEVARERSQHRPSAQAGGQLGFVSPSQARALDIPDAVYANLPDGTVSGILPHGGRFQVIRFAGERASTLAEHETHLRNVLRTEAYERRERQALEELTQRLHWQTAPAGLEVLRGRRSGPAEVQPWQLGAAEAAEPLFTYDGGVVTVGQYVQAVAAGGSSTVDAGSQLVDAAAAQIRAAVLYAAAAVAAGLDDGDEGERWRAGQTVELAITELRRRVLSDLEPVDDGAARAYYEQHPEVFRDSDQLVVLEALVDSLREAEEIVAAVRGGQSLADLAAARTRRGESLWQAPGVLRLGHKERLQMPQLYDAARRAETGQLVGPVEVHDGFSVFQVLDRQQGELPAFERVERRARALAQRQREADGFEAYVDGLLEKYDDDVAVYPAELVRALPDTLLQRLSQG